MEETKPYQGLGMRTLVYAIVTRSRIPFFILMLSLALFMVKNFFGASLPASVTDLIGNVIPWGFLVTLAVWVIIILIAWLGYTMFQFRLDEDIFKIKRGIFTKEETAIPYRRIESVDIRRTLVHQLFGVSRITIETTTDSESEGDNKSDTSDEVFPVIDQHLAQVIQEELTKRANVQKMRT